MKKDNAVYASSFSQPLARHATDTGVPLKQTNQSSNLNTGSGAGGKRIQLTSVASSASSKTYDHTHPIKIMNKPVDLQQNQSLKPIFEFLKIPNPDKSPPRRGLNGSMSTCPLTVSNLTLDSANFSICGGSSSGSMSNASQPTGIINHRMSNHPNQPSSNGGGDNIMRHLLTRTRNSSIDDPSWPAETPDPLTATARWWGNTKSYSPPTSSDYCQQRQQQQQGSNTDLYRPVRRSSHFIVPTKGDKDLRVPPSLHNLFPSHQHISPKRQRHSSFDTPLHPLQATIVFVDIESYSKSSDVHQRHLICNFMNTLRNLLTFAYDEMPVRGNIDNYVILPTGDGAAVIVIRPPTRRLRASNTSCEKHSDVSRSSHGLPQDHGHGISCSNCSSQSLRTTEEMALWIGSSLLLWASRRKIGLRVGLNSGELSVVEDPYGDPNVCGDAINMAARIMDTAAPGQILASASSVVPKLNILLAEDMAVEDMIGAYEDVVDEWGSVSLDSMRKKQDCNQCPRIKYQISSSASEVVVKHGVTTNVQSIKCSLHLLPRPEDLPAEFQPSEETPSTLNRAQTSQAASVDQLLLTHTMGRMRKNANKQSFASLSSLQPHGSSNSLKRGSRGSMSSMKKLSSCTIKSVPEQNASWDLSTTPKAQMRMPMRMSMLSQLSDEDNTMGSSSKTFPASNTTTQPLPQVVPQHVGNHRIPATKWYMKIKPTEMHRSSSNNQIKPKVLPVELMRRHQRIAFLGIMHDSLSRGFIKILEENPSHRWEQIYILFPSDDCLRNNLAENYQDQSVEQLIYTKLECRKALIKLLMPVVGDLKILQYDQLMHCGSYWDWKDPGGFIHISPLTWGANPKTCPAMNYYWNSPIPSIEYRVYNQGLEYLLKTAKPFIDEVVTLDLDAHDIIIEDGTQSGYSQLRAERSFSSNRRFLEHQKKNKRYTIRASL